MSASSDQGVGYFWNLVVGFIVLVMFGIGTFLISQVGGLKKPTDRVMEGDFSADQTALRIKNLEEVRQEQATAVSSEKLDSAIQNFKVPAPSATEVVVPGSPTSLKAAPQPPAPAVPENPPAEAKSPPQPPSPGKAATPKGNAGKGKGKGQAAPKGGKAKANTPGKGSAKGSQPAKAQGN